MENESAAQLKSILDFADHLLKSLNQCRDNAQQHFPDVLPYINILPFPSADASKSQKSVLRSHATKIWNICNHLTLSDHHNNSMDVAKLRAFACMLLISITPNKMRRQTIRSNLFSNTLIAGKACLRAGLLDLAEKVLQSEAAEDVLDTNKNEDTDPDLPPSSYLIEYYCLRALLEWQRRRLDLTDYWYRRVNPSGFELQETEIQKVVDLCYEIGRDCLSHSDNEALVAGGAWLERALSLLDHKYYQHLFAASDLWLNVMHSLVRTLARLSDHASREKAHKILEQLKSEYGSKLPILLLSLEIIRQEAGSASACAAYGLQVEELIRSVHLIDANHRLIMYYIRQLSRASQDRAARCLKMYVLHRLIPEKKFEWVEQAIINSVAIASSVQPADATATLQALEQDLTLFADALKCELPPGVAQAAHALIWKMVRETDTDNTRTLAMLWCQIGLHPIFTPAGETGNGKLERQLITYQLLVSNTSLAQKMLEQMSFMQKNNRSSRYLAYCVAIRSGNDTDAQSCLNTITNGQGENDLLLFACIGESLKYGTTLNTARLVLRLLEKRLQNPSLNADLGGLLQYAAKLFLQALAEQTPDHETDQEVPARLCSIFKHATRFHTSYKIATRGSLQPRMNTSWFEKCSFNLASEYIKTWPRRYTIDLLGYCRQLCEAQDGMLTGVSKPEQTATRMRECFFLQTILYAAEARSMSADYSVEDLPESSYESRSKPKTSECREVLHRNVFKIYTTLQKQFIEAAGLGENLGAFKSQLHVLTPLAFEALLLLNVNSCFSNGTNFDEMSGHQFLQATNDLELPVASYAVLADTLLTLTVENGGRDGLRIPRVTAASLLGKIIQALRRAPSYDVEQAARWIRCVTQLMFEDIEAILANRDVNEMPKTNQQLMMLETLIQQALNLVKTATPQARQEANSKGQQGAKGSVENLHQYPEEEIHWLVTKMWNMAIDFHGIEQTETAKQWAGKAVQMAEVGARGEGIMVGVVAQLKDNVKRLGWEA